MIISDIKKCYKGNTRALSHAGTDLISCVYVMRVSGILMLAILHAYIAIHQCQEANESDDVVANVWKPSKICLKKKSIENLLDKDFATTIL